VTITATTVLVDAFERIREAVHGAVEDLPPESLNTTPEGGGNSISWLVWHLTRVQDDHLADAMETEQIWTSEGWHERFGLSLPASDTGFGHSPADVASVRVDSGELLTGYHDAVHARTVSQVKALKATELERIVDYSWTPAVTLAVRLVSVIEDDLQHAGQAAYVRGLLALG
jgi:uncharacterized damage-inducible protein DinB